MKQLFIPSLYSVDELVNIGERTLNFLEPLVESDPKLKKQFQSFEGLYDELVDNQVSTTDGPLTVELALADEKRDQAFRCFKFISQGMSMSLLADSATNGVMVYEVIEKYGIDLYRVGYKAETGLLISVFGELDKTKNQAAMTELGLLPYYESLKTAQTEFDSLHKQSDALKAEASKNKRPASTIKKEYTPELEKLLSLYQLYAELDAENYAESYAQLVEYIKEVNATARARQTRKENEPEEVTPDE